MMESEEEKKVGGRRKVLEEFRCAYSKPKRWGGERGDKKGVWRPLIRRTEVNRITPKEVDGKSIRIGEAEFTGKHIHACRARKKNFEDDHWEQSVFRRSCIKKEDR